MHLVSGYNGGGGMETFDQSYRPVFKYDGSTIKVRVVFDLSVKNTNGHSINVTLFIGPTVWQGFFQYS